jgi:hypothetical protein
MSSAALHSHVPYRLGEAEAHGLWNWLLRRQGLSDSTRLNSVESIAHAALGLHSARLPSPYSTLAARSAGSDVALSLFHEATRSRVMIVRCMRKTLHTLPLPLAAAAHVATLHFRERDALRAVAKANESITRVQTVVGMLVDTLGSSGALFHRDVETALSKRAVAVNTTRLALKLAWERGVIAYTNETDGWNREVRKFSVTSETYPEFDIALDRDAATVLLVEAYFDRYGPASLGDAVWWSGLSRGAVMKALQRSGRGIVALSTPWSDEPHYMYQSRFEEFSASSPKDRTTQLNFLAHEDVALKAYFDSRSRYLAQVPQRRAFNQIGEVLPTVLHQGRVVGTWSWNDKAGRADCRIVPGCTTPELREAIRAELQRLSGVLRLGRSAVRASTLRTGSGRPKL